MPGSEIFLQEVGRFDFHCAGFQYLFRGLGTEYPRLLRGRLKEMALSVQVHQIGIFPHALSAQLDAFGKRVGAFRETPLRSEPSVANEAWDAIRG